MWDEGAVGRGEWQVAEPFFHHFEDLREAEDLVGSLGQIGFRYPVAGFDRADRRARVSELGAQFITAQARLMPGLAQRVGEQRQRHSLLVAPGGHLLHLVTGSVGLLLLPPSHYT